MSSAGGLEEIVAPLLTRQQVITMPMSSLSVMYFIYGIYTIVFGLSIRVLLRRNVQTPSNLYFWCTIALFILNTLYVASSTWMSTSLATVEFDAAKSKDYMSLITWIASGDWFTSVPNVTMALSTNLMIIFADAMLIHRCYVIWNSNKVVLWCLSFIAVILNGLNFATFVIYAWGNTGEKMPSKRVIYEQGSHINNGCAVAMGAFTLLLAFLTGGRIWWISREARKMMGQSTNAKYNAIVAIIIESGLLYASTLFLNIIFEIVVNPKFTSPIPFQFAVISTQMSGFAPTLIIVRVAYGSAIQSVQQMVSTLQFASPNEQQQRDGSDTSDTIDLDLRLERSGREGEKMV